MVVDFVLSRLTSSLFFSPHFCNSKKIIHRSSTITHNNKWFHTNWNLLFYVSIDFRSFRMPSILIISMNLLLQIIIIHYTVWHQYLRNHFFFSCFVFHYHHIIIRNKRTAKKIQFVYFCTCLRFILCICLII